MGIDCGVFYKGYCGDAARTFAVGKVDEQAERLLRVTEEALKLAVAQVRPGARVQDIGYAVQRHAESNGYSVVREFTGHGIGTSLHEEPQVPNFGIARQGAEAQAGDGAGDRADGQRRRARRQDGPRRLDGAHRGRVAVGPLRVFGGGDRRREPGCWARTGFRRFRREEGRLSTKEEAIEVEATVVEPLPNAMFRVEVELNGNKHRCWRTSRGRCGSTSSASCPATGCWSSCRRTISTGAGSSTD